MPKNPALAPTYGWDITQRIQQISEEVLKLTRARYTRHLTIWKRRAGSFPNAANLDISPRANYYKLVPTGRKQLAEKRETLARFCGAIERILQATYLWSSLMLSKLMNQLRALLRGGT
ncbi:MAG TPA: hypothetical protein VN643_01210 [Pyrinomonadaceae bacterium]|nr:hypothetical protein [Pyrinomonadaceae bacterium]